MFQKFYPDYRADSAYQIDFQDWYEKGIRGVLFDIDNTLVEHGKPATDRAIALFAHLKELGLATCLISNNKEKRVNQFNEQIQTHTVINAHKPSKKGYQMAMEKMGTDPTNTLFVGDQLFTDVWGAKRLGIPTILVNPIDKKEEIQIVLKRRLEWIVLAEYERRKRK